LQQVFKKAGYKAKGSFMGKDMTVSIPKTSTYGGKKMTDPRQFIEDKPQSSAVQGQF